MADVSSKKFAAAFARAFADSGRLSPNGLQALKAARAAITGRAEAAAADRVLAMVRHDVELDDFEVEPMRAALGVLTGVASGRLPADLEATLKHAVPQANVRVKHYDLAFDFSGTGPKFPARAVLSLERAASSDAVLEANPERLTISGVLADGRAVPFRLVDGRLHVTAPGAKVLRVDYTVTPDDTVSPDSFGLIRDKYTGRMWTMTWPYNTGALFPSNSAPSDGSTSSVHVKVARGLEVVGTGTAGADGTFSSFTQSPAYAIATYVAPKFELGDGGVSAGGVAVSSFGKADARVAEASRAAYREAARASLDFYGEWLGLYEYGPTLKLIELDGGLGGMEHTAAVAIMLNAARDKDVARRTAAHETAHHWFGDNLRIKTWGDFWMSEGFTNYATYRYFRHAEGDRKYFELLDEARDSVRDALRENPHALSAPPETDVLEIFDSVPYELGPWMLRMMECELGTGRFDSLLRQWYQDHRQQAVSTAQFVAYAREKTGHDFAPFFARWNKLTAVPRFEPEVKQQRGSLDVTLTATNQAPEGIKVPLLVEGATQSTTVLVTPGQKLHVEPGFEIRRLRWDPERTVLAYVK